MLHVRVASPHDLTPEVVDFLRDQSSVAHLMRFDGAGVDDGCDLLTFSLAREDASNVIDTLRDLELHEHGSISFDDIGTQFSKAAHRAEQAAPGRPEDGVIWEAIEADAVADAKLSWSFVVFLCLACLIASVGRYLDQPILIVGSMVVGPEFAPLFAMCFGITRGRWRIVPVAATTIVGGFVVATSVTWAFWAGANLFFPISEHQAASGTLTSFIVQPDSWSLVIAILAGMAGTLSMTASKSSPLVGVFISVTTVPAAGTFGLALAMRLWPELGEAAVQLGVNFAGILIAGIVTLLVQRAVWTFVSRQHGRTGTLDHIDDTSDEHVA